MQIDGIDIYHAALPLRQPCEGRSTLETVLVRMRSGDAVGWGEASPGNGPLKSPEWAGGVFAAVRDWLAPRVVGQAPSSGNSLQEMLDAVQGNRYAKSALDLAWWDLNAKMEGKSLPELLGKSRDAIEVGVGFDRMETIDELFVEMGKALEAGFSRIELKYRPGWEVAMLNAVRGNFPAVKLHIDVEGGLRIGHMDMLCRLDDFFLAMIEQPLSADDFVGHAMVQDTIRTPICLDESITTLAQAEMALDLQSAKFVNLKPGRVGGLTTASAIYEACRDHEVGCWVGAVPQSALGFRFGMALASKEGCDYPADYIDSAELLAVDLAPPLVPVRSEADGVLRVPLWSEPGIGVEPDLETLEKYAIQKASLG